MYRKRLPFFGKMLPSPRFRGGFVPRSCERAFGVSITSSIVFLRADRVPELSSRKPVAYELFPSGDDLIQIGNVEHIPLAERHDRKFAAPYHRLDCPPCGV